jgi:hypothetical protein
MNKYDQIIKIVDDKISKNIAILCDCDRNLLNQNILGDLRTLVEKIAIKLYFDKNPKEPFSENLELTRKAISLLAQNRQTKFLFKFHKLLQISCSHYIQSEDYSERLMIKYYDNLIEIRTFLKDKYDLNILTNIEKIQHDNEEELSKYYEEIAKKIDDKDTIFYSDDLKRDKYYIHKIKTFYINNKTYYEITFFPATDNSSKFDRVIAFTNIKIIKNYAVRFSFIRENINILNKTMSILIISNWEIAIRDCEFKNFIKIFSGNTVYNTNHNESKQIMLLLTKNRINLLDIIEFNDDEYSIIKKQITANLSKNNIVFLNFLDKAREIVKSNKSGSNIIKYLLYKMNNRIIKSQLYNQKCTKLSDLYLKRGCIPFEDMPFCTSLINHNPPIFDLLDCIDFEDREYEFFGREIKNNAEKNCKLFTSEKELQVFNNIPTLIQKHNNLLFVTHQNRELEVFKGYIFIKGYVEDCIFIIKKLIEYTTSGIKNYENSTTNWLKENCEVLDCSEKKKIIINLFKSSRVALIYGSAGTGKTTIIQNIASRYERNSKLFLTNTNPALNNLQNKVSSKHSDFLTIAKFLSRYNNQINYDLLVIDECSTVSNRDIKQVMDKIECKLIILVGDEYQIQSIVFGNWFFMAKKFLPQYAIFELKERYRTKNTDLLRIWDSVRNREDNILELLLKNNSISYMNESIFEKESDDQIILCLNYDGLYGINNINRILQNNNKNSEIEWEQNNYKIGDPILFNETNRFSPLIYNNMKGRILNIEKDNDQIRFTVEIPIIFDEMDAALYDFDYLENPDDSKSIISFIVNSKNSSQDEDTVALDKIIPFQVAYAISMHKAQGLEYNSVKIVVSNEIEENITHNIFYTAITRTKKNLKIYWAAETEERVLKSIKNAENCRDVGLIRAKAFSK